MTAVARRAVVGPVGGHVSPLSVRSISRPRLRRRAGVRRRASASVGRRRRPRSPASAVAGSAAAPAVDRRRRRRRSPGGAGAVGRRVGVAVGERRLLRAGRRSRASPSSARRATLRISAWKLLPIFFSSAYVRPARRSASGSFSGPRTTSASSRITMISLPDRLNTRRSLRSCHHRPPCNNGSRRCSSGPSRSPIAAPAPTPGEHARGLRAGPAPRRDRARERRLADRRRRPGARPRRRRAASAGASGRSPTLRRADLPEHIPTLADLLAALRHATTTCRSTSRTSASGRPVIDVVRASRARAAAAAVAVPPRPRPCCAGCAPSTTTVRLVNSTQLGRMKEGPERRAAMLADAGIDAVNLHHTDWTGGLTTLFHRFERVCFGWDLQFEHVLRPVAADGHRRRLQRPRRRDGRRLQPTPRR